MSDETLQQNQVLQAIAELSKQINKRIDDLETSVNSQFETIREGIVYNSSKFDRLEAVVYSQKSDISNLRADIKDLTEEVHQLRKGSLVTLEK